MKANYDARIDIPGYISGPIGRREAERLMKVKDYYEEQCETEKQQLTMVIISAMLFTLHERYHFRAETLRAIYQDMVRTRAELKHDFRAGYAYQEQKTGRNVEDTYYRQQLLGIGVDLEAWENGVQYDPKTGKVEFK